MARLFIDELGQKMRECEISNITIRASDTMFCVTASNGQYTGVSTKKDIQEAIFYAVESVESCGDLLTERCIQMYQATMPRVSWNELTDERRCLIIENYQKLGLPWRKNP